MPGALDPADEALLGLLKALDDHRYRFVTTTPRTHARVTSRPSRALAEDARDVFGWSLPFARDLLPAAFSEPLFRSGMVREEGRLWRSRVRVSSIDDTLFLHSAYPTDERDSVFLGPDSYRFVRFIRGEIGRSRHIRHLVDIGTGAGVGAVMAAPLTGGARVTMTDINPLALRFARLNARHAGVAAHALEGSGIDGAGDPVDLVIANPPFIVDPAARAYRHGGAMLGAELSLEWALAAARRIVPGGRMLLYTGSAIVRGRDDLEEALQASLPPLCCTLRYNELDPDIFGEQLDAPGYEDVERIAAIGCVIVKGGG